MKDASSNFLAVSRTKCEGTKDSELGYYRGKMKRIFDVRTMRLFQFSARRVSCEDGVENVRLVLL